MKIKTLEKMALQALKSTFEEIPVVQSVEIQGYKQLDGPDFNVSLEVDDLRITILVEMKASGQPRFAREAINQLLRFQREQKSTYLIFLAPYISPAAGKLCNSAGVGYIDLAGNVYLAFGSVFISREGKKNPYATSRRLKSLYQPASSRILRVLLSDPSMAWKTQPLSDRAKVSLGQISNVRQDLKNREWIEELAEGFRLSQPAELLAEWANSYSFQKNIVRSYYTLDSAVDAEIRIAEVCQKEQIKYALTCFSGAARLAPNVRYNRVDIYVAKNLERVSADASLKPVESGANVRLIEPYDEGVFYGSRTVSGLDVASPVQIYLDVLTQKGRGEEAAESILNQVIKTQW